MSNLIHESNLLNIEYRLKENNNLLYAWICLHKTLTKRQVTGFLLSCTEGDVAMRLDGRKHKQTTAGHKRAAIQHDEGTSICIVSL